MTALAMCLIIPAFEAVSPTTVSAAPPGPEVVYDAIGPSVPGSVTSVSFQATRTSELGDLVQLAPGSRVLQDITVEMVSWACETNTWSSTFCSTTVGKTFDHPLTIKLYSVAGTPAAPQVGTLLASATQTAAIPFRPGADDLNCLGDDLGKWYDGAVCRNGYAFPVTFADVILPDIILPGQVIWTLSFNTSTYGTAPIGPTCVPSTNCGYDSLNVGSTQLGNPTPFVGTDLNPNGQVVASTSAGSYCPSVPTPGALLATGTCGTGLRPMARITAKQTGFTPVTTIVDPGHANQWIAVRENPSTVVYPNPTFVNGPGTPPNGNGSAQLTTTATTEGQSLLTTQFNGTRLADITTIGYTIQTTGAVPALSFDIKYRPTDALYSGRLIYEPINSGVTVVPGWNTLNPLAGKWWGSRQQDYAADNNCNNAAGVNGWCTWSEVLAKWPEARLANPTGSVGNLVIKLGSGVPAATANIDSVVFGVTDSTGSITVTTFNFENKCLAVCYVSATGVDTNSGTSSAQPLRNIQTAVNAVNTGGIVNVAAGLYNEDVSVNKAVTLQGAGAASTTVSGPIGGGDAAFDVSAANVVIDGFTVTRDGNNVTDWQNPALNTFGVLIGAGNVELRNSVVTGNRTGVDVRNGASAGSVNVHNNVITANRTGLNFFGNVPASTVTQNAITDNFTAGVLFQGDPSGTFVGTTITNNNIAGNWYGQIVNRQINAAVIDFSGNWLGTTTPVVTTANSSEAGYAASFVPQMFGGTGTAPAAPQPTIAGPDSAGIDFTPFLDSGADTDPVAPGFQGSKASVTVTAAGAQTGSAERLQEGVDTVPAAGTVHVAAGTYPVATSVNINKGVSLLGPNAGVSPNGVVDPIVANPARVAEATINAGSIVALRVGAADVTIDGFTLKDDGLTTGANLQSPIIGGGGNFLGSAPGLKIVNNLFQNPSRIAVYTNGSALFTGVDVDDNRIVNAIKSPTCAGTCGVTLFNLWQVDDVSFSRNVITMADAGSGVRSRTLSINTTANTPVGIVIADNVQRNGCNFTCISIAGMSSNYAITGNDFSIAQGNAISLFRAGSAPFSDWSGSNVDVNHNSFSVTTDFAIAVDSVLPLNGVTINRNAFTGGASRNSNPQTLNLECNSFGSPFGPVPAQLVGLNDTDPFLISGDLDGGCPPGSPVTSTQTVTFATLNGWSWLTDGAVNDNQPVTPKLVVDSGGLNTGAAAYPTVPVNDAIMIVTNAYKDTKLADLTAISYRTFSSSTTYAPTLGFEVNYSGAPGAWQGRLSFIPAGDTSGWKTWNTFDPAAGRWFASNAAGGICNADSCTWNQVLSLFPNATIDNPSNAVDGRLFVRAGDTSSNVSGLTLHTDAVTVGRFIAGVNTIVTTDFEPTAPGVATNVLATPLDGKATLTWNPPVNTGGLPVTYTITGATCTVAPSGVAATCEPLTNGTLYNLSIMATNPAGNSAVVVAPVTPSSSSVSSVAYDSIGPDPQSSYLSVGFEATSAKELGDLVELSPGPRNLDEITVQMVAWGCQDTTGGGCVSAPDSSFTHPITVVVYAVGGTPTNPTVGDELARVTQLSTIPFRPSADPTCTSNRWKDAQGNCRNGYAFPLTFDFLDTDTVLPEQVIWTIQYNTQHRGYAPINSCLPDTNCAYDSLNVGTDSRGNADAFVGVDLDSDALFWNSSFDFYCDNPSVINTLREDCDWTGNRPMATITTTDVVTTPVAKTVKTATTQGWTWWTDGAATATIAPKFSLAVPPTTTQDGSAGFGPIPANDARYVATGDYDGTRLSSLTELSYITNSSSSTDAPQLALEVKLTPGATTWQGRLVFIPSGDTSGWKTWNTMDPAQGKWYASSSAAGVMCRTALCTWEEVLAYWPSIEIDNPDIGQPVGTKGRIGVRGGDTAADLSAATLSFDTFVIGQVVDGENTVTTYDFEPTRPSAPTGVTAIAGDAQATISWTAPAAGDFPITGYTVTGAPAAACSTATTSCLITGLTNGTTYSFTVVATSAVGAGPASAAATAKPASTTQTPVVVTSGTLDGWSFVEESTGDDVALSPTFAQGPAPTPLGTGSALIPVVAANKAIAIRTSDYQGVALSAITDLAYSTYQTNTALQAPTLSFDVNYDSTVVSSSYQGRLVYVPAVASAGWNTWLPMTGSRWYASNQTASGSACSSANLCSWAQIRTLFPNAMIDNPATAIAAGLLIRGGSTDSTAGFTGNVDKVVIGVDGGAVITVKTFNFEPTLPAAATNVVATPGNTQINLTWTAPANNGGLPIQSYAVTSVPAASTCNVVGAATSVTCSGLVNGTSYTFTVTATTAMGASPASLPSAPVAPLAVASPPTAVTATAGDQQVTLSWTTPLSNGGSPITSYTVTGAPAGTCAPLLATTCVITGLTNGTSYLFSVVANNTASASLPGVSNPAVPFATVPSTVVVNAAGLNGWSFVEESAGPDVALSSTFAVGPAPAPAGSGSALIPTITANKATAIRTSDYQGTTLASITALSYSTYQSDALLPAPTLSFDVNFGVGSPTAYQGRLVFVPAPVAAGWSTFNTLAGARWYASKSTSVGSDGVCSAGSWCTWAQILAAFPNATIDNPETVTAAGLLVRAGSTSGEYNGFTGNVDKVVVGVNTAGVNAVKTFDFEPTTADASTTVQATAGNTTASVSWTAPVNTGGLAITGYTVTPIGGVGSCVVAGAATSVNCTSLTNGTSYTFTVTAITAAGPGATSAPSNPVVPFATVPSTVVVNAAGLNGWSFVEESAGPDVALSSTFAVGPAPAPAGSGSALIPTITANKATAIRTSDYQGTTLASITALSYSTYQSDALLPAPTLSFDVNFGVGSPTAYQGRLVFVPAPVAAGWSTFNTLAGARWYASKSTSVGSDGVCSAGSWCTWAQILAAFPNATIDNPETVTAAGLLVRAGSTSGEYNGFTGNVDKVVVGVNTAGANAVKTFDFEPVGPTAATGVTATADIRSATVAWTPPANNGGQPLTYTVVSNPVGAPCTVTGLTAACTGLVDNGTYTFVVTATNASGSTPSAPSSSITTPNVPSAPAPATGVIGNGSVTLTWAIPSNVGGRPVTGYTVARTPVGATCIPATATSCVISDLDNGTDYTFTVTAQNAVGSGIAATSLVLRPLAVPDQPTAVSATPGNAQATVSWTAPAVVGGSPIMSYTVTSSPGGLTCPTLGTLTCTISGLTNGTPYTFTVIATNAQGSSPASGPSAAVTPFTVPSVPTAVTATAGTTSSTISWTAPAGNGRAITGYTVAGVPGGTCTTATLTCTITGLTAGTPYTFTVYATNIAGNGGPSSPTSPVTPFTVPTAPQAVSSTASIGQAIITWAPPVSNGASPVTGYTVAGSPTGACTTTTALTCTITGLTGGTSYTFSVRAINAAGVGPASIASPAVTAQLPPVSPTDVLDFTSVGPKRVFDTRPGQSLDALRSVTKTKVGGAYEMQVQVTDLAGLVPSSGVGAVSLNITATNPDNSGFITVYSCGTREAVSSVNFAKGQTVANAVIAPVSALGTVCFYSNTTVDIIGDVNGWFAAGKAFSSVGPKRVFDTRPGLSAEALRTVAKAPVAGGNFIEVKMSDLAGFVPADGVGAVSLNVTVTNPAASGYITVYSCGTREQVSSVNYTSGATVANAVVAPVSATGTVCFFSTATTDLIVDINGWLKAGSGFTGVSPKRVLDTRAGQSPDALRNVVKQQVGGGYVLEVQVSDLPGATPAASVGAVSLNVTATGSTLPGFVTVYSCGTREAVSSVNFTAGGTVANAVLSPVSASGSICLFSNTPVDLVVDINGWFSDVPTP